MKTLPINSVQFNLAIQSFQDWLATLSYSESAIKNYPVSVRELLHYAERNSINQLYLLTPDLVYSFTEHVKTRKNVINGAGLSSSSVNSSINAIVKFTAYLRLTKQIHLRVELKRLKQERVSRDILSRKELDHLIESLLADFNPIAKRNRAIISTLYAAGLRRNELVQLNIEDVSFYNKTIHIKNGKGGKERLIPIISPYIDYMKDYVKNCRDTFEMIATNTSNALFIDVDGLRLTGDYIEKLVKKLIEKSHIISLQEKSITLHSFRHSIATHLLQGGMELEDIAQFLGHSSLDSTMIYTHIAEEINLRENA